MFEPEFLEVMKDTVTIAPFLYMDSKKVKVYGTPVEFRARISGKMVSLRRPGTEDVSTIVDVWLNAGGTKISLQDRLTLPTDARWLDQNPIIFAVGRYDDPDGEHNVKVQCGWMYHRQGQ